MRLIEKNCNNRTCAILSQVKVVFPVTKAAITHKEIITTAK